MARDRLKAQERWCLIEAHRRLTTFHRGEPPLEAWSGLGTRTDYKQVLESGMMDWTGGMLPPTRCMGWLVLTSKGLAEMLLLTTIE